MNIKDLEYYQKLVATHSYTKTAEFFNLSQPSISAAVKRLSKEFRTLRKRREEDSLRPQQWNLESIWNDEKWGSWGKLSTVAWGVSPIVGKVYLAKILTELDQENLNHNIEITEAGSNDLSAKLKNGEINIALLNSLSPINNNHYQSKLLRTNSVKLIVSQQHHHSS